MILYLLRTNSNALEVEVRLNRWARPYAIIALGYLI
jgi:hypothetical protein